MYTASYICAVNMKQKPYSWLSLAQKLKKGQNSYLALLKGDEIDVPPHQILTNKHVTYV